LIVTKYFNFEPPPSWIPQTFSYTTEEFVILFIPDVQIEGRLKGRVVILRQVCWKVGEQNAWVCKLPSNHNITKNERRLSSISACHLRQIACNAREPNHEVSREDRKTSPRRSRTDPTRRQQAHLHVLQCSLPPVVDGASLLEVTLRSTCQHNTHRHQCDVTVYDETQGDLRPMTNATSVCILTTGE